MFFIYKITNLLNNKSYIGRTSRLKTRLNSHIRGDKGKNGKIMYIGRAIKKYGNHNFKYEIIYETDNKQEHIDKEIEFINSHNTLSPNGYNLITKLNNLGVISESTKNKMSRNSQGRISPNRKETTRYIGVSLTKGRIVLTVRFKNKIISRLYNNEINAAETYDKCMLFLHGKNAKINFEDRRQEFLLEDLDTFYKKFEKTEYFNKFPNIRFDEKSNKWYIQRSYIKFPQIIRLKYFDTEKDAAIMLDYLILFFKMSHPLNFPEIKYDINVINSVITDVINVKHPISKYKGVKWHDASKKWMATHNQKYLGIFISEDEAYSEKEKYKKHCNM